jgi:hypothetical protein
VGGDGLIKSLLRAFMVTSSASSSFLAFAANFIEDYHITSLGWDSAGALVLPDVPRIE